MIIKLPIPFIAYARHKEAKTPKTLTFRDKINADRVVMIVLLAITVAGAVITS